ncbi:MAG TPA: hypothetical protein GXX35_08100 [Thermoanaerobacterales bacterium]|nr:hypothetical protein [Thermoanaerobacterales bacterium]
MWPIIFNPFALKTFLSVFLTGMVVKIMDDYMDMEFDELIKKDNITRILRLGTLPYALFIFSLACILNPPTAISLFFASFSTGMAGNLNAKMPSGLYGYQESILTIIMAVVLFGAVETFSSLFLIIAIQLWDDYADYRTDIYSTKNWAFLLGKNECLLLGIIFFISSLYLDFFKALSGIFSLGAIVNIINLWFHNVNKLEKPDEEAA